jgi:hypothetical protein
MKSLPGPAHGLEPTAQQLRPLLLDLINDQNSILEPIFSESSVVIIVVVSTSVFVDCSQITFQHSNPILQSQKHSGVQRAKTTEDKEIIVGRYKGRESPVPQISPWFCIQVFFRYCRRYRRWSWACRSTGCRTVVSCY